MCRRGRCAHSTWSAAPIEVMPNIERSLTSSPRELITIGGIASSVPTKASLMQSCIKCMYVNASSPEAGEGGQGREPWVVRLARVRVLEELVPRLLRAAQ